MVREEGVDTWAKKIWDYCLMHQKLKKAEAIVVFGSYNPIVAVRAAELLKQGYASLAVFSGGRSDSTEGWEKTEAETLAEAAISAGAPPEKIILEKEARNSGENILFTKHLLDNRGLKVRRIITVQKPYSERRLYAALRRQWPEAETIVTSPKVSYEAYMASSPIGKARSIGVMVGDLQRLKLYAERGFQIPQEIPDDVWQAYEKLVALGFTKSFTK